MTPMHEDEARARLQGVTPGARPDVDAIIRTGRRRNRNAAIARATAAVVVVAGIGAGAVTLWQRPHQDAVPAPLQTPSEAPAPSPTPDVPTQAPATSPTDQPSPSASGTTTAPRTWPTIRGLPGGQVDVDGVTVGRVTDEESRTTAEFMALMGAPDAQESSATCRTRPLKNTTYRWGDFQVVVLDEEDKDNEYGFAFPAGQVAGWTIDPTLDGKPGLSFPMTGPEGAQIGDSVATLQKLFPADDWDYAAVEGDTFGIFAGDTTGAAFPLDADQKVRAMGAGYDCT